QGFKGPDDRACEVQSVHPRERMLQEQAAGASAMELGRDMEAVNLEFEWAAARGIDHRPRAAKSDQQAGTIPRNRQIFGIATTGGAPTRQGVFDIARLQDVLGDATPV